MDSEAVLSRDVLKKLRANRKIVIEALVEKFASMDVTNSAYRGESKISADEVLEDSGVSTYDLSQLLLNITIDLNAVEALPHLLRVEAELSTMLEMNAADPSLILPEKYVDAGFIDEADLKERIEDTDREKETFQQRFIREAKHRAKSNRQHCIVAQRDLLATILCLLRQEKYSPLLSSDVEKSYRAEVLKNAAEENFGPIKKESDIKEEDRAWIIIDPIINAPTAYAHPQAKIPYTPVLRATIRGWANSWLETTPAPRRDGTKGMTISPVER
jgi:hypothetical protein